MEPSSAKSVLNQFLVSMPAHWPQQLDLLTWCHEMGPAPATLLVIAGIIYLLFGYYLFNWLVMLNAAVLAAYAGGMIGARLGSAPAGAILAGITAAVVTWPLMKWAVAVMGGIYGAIVGACVWRSTGIDPTFAWAGAMTGLVFFGLLSFIIFRGCVILYTSLQGTFMLILGLLSLLFKYQVVAQNVTHHMAARPFMLPITVFVLTLLAMVFQQSQFPAGPSAKK